MQKSEEIILREKLWLSLDDEMYIKNAFLSALLILQVWWYLKFAVISLALAIRVFLFLTSFLLTHLPVNYFTWSINLYMYCKGQ